MKCVRRGECCPVFYTYSHAKDLQLSDRLDYHHADCDLLILIPPTFFSSGEWSIKCISRQVHVHLSA